VKNLLPDRLKKAKECLEDAFEALHQLCKPVPQPKQIDQYFQYFCGNPSKKNDLKKNEEKRVTFYKLVVDLIRAYNNIASEMIEAGYKQKEADKLKAEVNNYVDLRDSIKERSGDYIDMKKYEPDMRLMLDMYLTADASRVLSNLGDATLLQLIVENGIDDAIGKLSSNNKRSKSAMSETIENNMRRTIIEETPINPAYYEKMSVLLEELIKLRKEEAITYEELLKRYEKLAKDIQPDSKKSYPKKINTNPRQAFYDNLNSNEKLAIELDEMILNTKDSGWRRTQIKRRKVEIVIKKTLQKYGIKKDSEVKRIFELASNQIEY
jgi:type I restriction enzyme R subunit